MTRTISPSMAGILQALELERPMLVTTEDLKRIIEVENIHTPARIVAARLREAGWLLQTGQRGVWEFAPAAMAGAYSSCDPLLGLRSYLARHPNTTCGITFQTAAWVYGYSSRVPAKPEIAAQDVSISRALPESLSASVFVPRLEYEKIKGVPVLAKESIIVHMCEKPMAIRSWESAVEWLVELAADIEPEKLMAELSFRRQSTKTRTGYLLKGIRPDVAAIIYAEYKPKSKTWFGPRQKLLRHDNKWLVADTILPFDAARLEIAK